MHIVVCVKQIPNPEAAFSTLKVDEHAKTVVPAAGLPLVMSPFDEQALEAALRVRESLGSARITALSVGPESARNVLKHALAMGADDALLVADPALQGCGSEVAALALAAAIRSLGAVDLVLTGRQAADWDNGVAAAALAERLSVPIVTFARKVEVSGGSLRVERVLADGFEVVAGELPALVSISNELGTARTPNLRETMRAARKPLEVRTAAAIGLTSADIGQIAGPRVRERLYVPVQATQCEFPDGADERARAEALVLRLREARLV